MPFGEAALAKPVEVGVRGKQGVGRSSTIKVSKRLGTPPL
jgi:hypothetical protein